MWVLQQKKISLKESFCGAPKVKEEFVLVLRCA